MLPSILLCSSSAERRKKKTKTDATWRNQAIGFDDAQFPNSVTVNVNPLAKPTRLSLCSDYGNSCSFRGGSVKAARKKGEKMSRVSNFSDLIQRVTASCLLHPLGAQRYDSGDAVGNRDAEEVYEYETDEHEHEHEHEHDEEEDEEEAGGGGVVVEQSGYRAKEIEPRDTVMVEVFEAVSAMKKAYVRLQEAHCPWDAENMRAADAAVVAEMRKIAVLRERFRRISVSGGGGGGGGRSGGRGGIAMSAATVREVVAPYEAAVEELRREVKARELEVENLKEKLNSLAGLSGGGVGKKGRSLTRKKVSCSQAQVAISPSPELYEVTMSKVNDALKSFTSLLLSLMRSAHWDIAAAVRSIEAASAAADCPTATTVTTITTTSTAITAQHAKYALESYVSRKVFQGFDHETFYMDGSLSSLLNPDQFRRDCFTQYRDMKAMDPSELLGILPTCHFGKFSSKKYLAVVHPKMEESLFGDLEQHRQVVAGNHPRSQFYGQFLELAKAVWLLHLLAFSLDPVANLFEASRGAEFHPQYMESVVKFPSGRLPSSMVVGFPVSPGFKLWNGTVIKARVYLVSRS